MIPDQLFKSIYGETVYHVSPHTVVILDVQWNQLPSDQKILLNKILQAVKLSVDGVRILYQQRFDVSDWKEKPHHVLAFISPPKGFTLYEVISTSETMVIFSAPLGELIKDEPARRNLWGALKSLFQAQ